MTHLLIRNSPTQLFAGDVPTSVWIDWIAHLPTLLPLEMNAVRIEAALSAFAQSSAPYGSSSTSARGGRKPALVTRTRTASATSVSPRSVPERHRPPGVLTADPDGCAADSASGEVAEQVLWRPPPFLV